jgi:hypothetical protein
MNPSTLSKSFLEIIFDRNGYREILFMAISPCKFSKLPEKTLIYFI